MLYDFLLVVTEADGQRICHSVTCRGPQIVGKAHSLLVGRHACEVEVWLGETHLHTLANPTYPLTEWGLAA
jgi:hypothetical protein